MTLRSLLTLVSLSLLISLPAVTWAQSGRDEEKRVQEKLHTLEMRDDVEETRDREKDLADSMQDDQESGSEKSETKGKEKAKSKGNERAQEMRDRRDKRKAIKEEYKSDREPGQEADSAMKPDHDSDDVDEVAKEKSKKPWWKFWGE